jgi:hypothetical protein
MLITLYDERTLLGAEEYEKMLQLLLWSSDQVCLPPQARLRQDLPDEISRGLITRLNELADAGLLTTYHIEGAPLLKAPGLLVLPKKTEKVVSREEYDGLFRDVRESTMRYRSQLAAARNVQLEGVTEYVTLQSHLWTIGLAGLLGSGEALTSDRRSATFARQVQKSHQASELRPPAIDALMKLNDIGSLYPLSTEDILKLRRYLPQVRSFIADVIDNTAARRPLAHVEALRSEVVEQVQHDYLELYFDLQKSNAQRARSLATDIAVTVLGYLYPPLSVITFTKPLAEWIESRRGTRRVMVFNMKLRKLTRAK